MAIRFSAFKKASQIHSCWLMTAEWNLLLGNAIPLACRCCRPELWMGFCLPARRWGCWQSCGDRLFSNCGFHGLSFQV